MKLNEIAYLRREQLELQEKVNVLNGTFEDFYYNNAKIGEKLISVWELVQKRMLENIKMFCSSDHWSVRLRHNSNNIWEIEKLSESLYSNDINREWSSLYNYLDSPIVNIKELIEQARNAGVLAYYDKKEKMLTFKV